MLWDGIQIFVVEKRHQKLFSQHDVKTNMAWLLYTHSDNHAIDYFANTIGTIEEKKYKFINIYPIWFYNLIKYILIYCMVDDFSV